MMKKRATAMLLGALLMVTGGVFAADTDAAKVPAKEMRLDGVERAKETQDDKSAQAELEKFRLELYRGI
jgi:Spy/CpxP family protein refolding chaperone